MIDQHKVITIDGPSGAGKGTLCRNLAAKLGWNLLDSGSLYRALVLAAQNHSISCFDKEALVILGRNLDLRFELSTKKDGVVVNYFLEGENITAHLQDEMIAAEASRIATDELIRQSLFDRQRDYLKAPGLVADGRDMGSVVFNEAQLKIFLTASLKKRGERRFEQLQQLGRNVSMQQILSAMDERDLRDRKRDVAALKVADGAHVIDTTDMDVAEVLKKTLSLFEASCAGGVPN